jgi:hypothetical protein
VNSFTSNFKNEIKVLIFVMMVMGVFEWYSRALVSKRVYYSSIPDYLEKVSGKLDEVRSSPKVLFVGNSLVMCGLDLPAASDEFSRKKVGAPYMASAYIMSSHIGEWYYLLKNFFVPRTSKPNSIIVWFSTNCLTDDIAPRVEVLSYICNFGDLPQLLINRARNFDERVSLALSFFSKAFLHKNDIRHSILNLLIHDYKGNMDRFYSTLKPVAAGKTGQVKTRSLQLDRFLQILKQMNTKVLFVAMPLRDWKYPINSDLVTKIRKAGYAFLDLREAPGLDKEDFLDSIHLNNKGASRFTRYLTGEIINKHGEFFAEGHGDKPRPFVQQATVNCLSDARFQDLKSKWRLSLDKDSTVTIMQENLTAGQSADVLCIKSKGDAQIFSEKIRVNRGKVFRFSLWIKRDPILAGSAWFGLYAYDINESLLPVYKEGRTAEENPYFWYGRLPDAGWHQIIGYLLPANSPDAWGKIPDANGAIFRLPDRAEFISMRFLSCYNHGKQVNTWFASPKIEEINPETLFPIPGSAKKVASAGRQ